MESPSRRLSVLFLSVGASDIAVGCVQVAASWCCKHICVSVLLLLFLCVYIYFLLNSVGLASVGLELRVFSCSSPYFFFEVINVLLSFSF